MFCAECIHGCKKRMTVYSYKWFKVLMPQFSQMFNHVFNFEDVIGELGHKIKNDYS